MTVSFKWPLDGFEIPRIVMVCHGLTATGNSATHSCSLTPPWWDGGENQKGKSEKTHGLG